MLACLACVSVLSPLYFLDPPMCGRFLASFNGVGSIGELLFGTSGPVVRYMPLWLVSMRIQVSLVLAGLGSWPVVW